MIEDACDINESLAQPPAAPDIDEDEIEREYDSLCAEIQMPVLPEPPQSFPRHMPEPPQSSQTEMELTALVA